MIYKLRALVKKVEKDSIQEHVDNVSREMEILGRNQRKC